MYEAFESSCEYPVFWSCEEHPSNGDLQLRAFRTTTAWDGASRTLSPRNGARTSGWTTGRFIGARMSLDLASCSFTRKRGYVNASHPLAVSSKSERPADTRNLEGCQQENHMLTGRYHSIDYRTQLRCWLVVDESPGVAAHRFGLYEPGALQRFHLRYSWPSDCRVHYQPCRACLRGCECEREFQRSLSLGSF